jgi:hypothetical protein
MYSRINENIFTAIVAGGFALIGTLLGITIPNIVNYFKYRNSRAIEINKILFNVMELWYFYYSGDAKVIIIELIKSLKNKFPYEDSKLSYESDLIQLFNQIIGPMVSKFKAEKHTEIKKDYQDSIKKLSEFDPILAFKLRGMESKYDDSGKAEEFLNRFSEEFSGSLESIGMLRSFLKNKLEFYNEDIPSDIEGFVLEISFKYDLMAHFRIRSYFKRIKLLNEKRIKEEIVELVGGLILLAEHEAKEKEKNISI